MAYRAAAFGGGAVIGTLGGLMGLGGAEFRLPLLIGAFRFPPLEAIILNKAMSLIVVTSALVFRLQAVPFESVICHWVVVVNLLAGSLLGAWSGASVATKLRSRTLYQIIAALLIVMAVIMLVVPCCEMDPDATRPALSCIPLAIAGVIAGFTIGVVASLLGVAGGELLIPTIVLLFGIDIKTAGSLSLAVSLPTMIVGFARYSRDGSFNAIGRNRAFVIVMAFGSIAGALIGGLLVGFVSQSVLYPLLATILLLSAIKVWQHR